MTAEESALVRQVLTRPTDDTPRLVYADWLDEHGQADLAEFIRVQVELAVTADPHSDRFWDGRLGEGPESHRRRKSLRLREREMANQWANPSPLDRWHGFPDGFPVMLHEADPMVPNAGPWADCLGLVRRGFVSEIRLPLAVFLAHARDLFAAHPITAVVLTCRQPWVNHDRTHWGWWLDNPAIHAPAPDSLPRPLADAMADDPTRYDYGIGTRYLPGGPAGWLLFRSADAAHAALSAACVAYGRERAGLPPLE